MACEQDGGITWKKTNQLKKDSDEDVWDDTALIKAYDRAVAQLKGEIESQSSDTKIADNEGKRKKKKKKTKKTNKKPWKVGSKCLAVYSEDGLYYEATILSIEARTALVRYDYYHNEEEVKISELLPLESSMEMQAVGNVETHVNENHVHANASSKNVPQATSSWKEKSARKDSSKSGTNWQISNLCYAPDGNGKYSQAVINSFTSTAKCFITFVKSGKRKEVAVELLRSKQNLWKQNGDRGRNFPSDAPNFWSMPQSMPPFPSFPSVPSPTLGWPTDRYHHTLPGQNNMFTPPFPPAPPLPPPPVIPDEIVQGDEEALANMLMSWYMSGYHTGYYQGTKRSKKAKFQSPSQPSTLDSTTESC